jgi:flagellar FliJ protein
VEHPPFKFRLERIRSVREQIEDKAREEFAASLALRIKGEGMLRAAEAELDAAHEHTRSTGTHRTLSATDLLAAQQWVEAAERQRQARALDLDRADVDVEHRRYMLQQASQDRQALEKIKDKRRREHEAEANRVAAIALDEMALNMHRRGQEAA